MDGVGDFQKRVSPWAVFGWTVFLGPMVGSAIVSIIFLLTMIFAGLTNDPAYNGFSFSTFIGMTFLFWIGSYFVGGVQAILAGGILALITKKRGRFTYVEAAIATIPPNVLASPLLLRDGAGLLLGLTVISICSALILRYFFRSEFPIPVEPEFA